MSKDELAGFRIEDLMSEIVRRQVAELDGTLRAMEVAVEQTQNALARTSLESLLQAKSAQEDNAPKPCPKCGKLVRVRARGRTRTLRAVAGEVSYRRNYHHCRDCGSGFYPLDDTLDLPVGGDLTREMERRLLDFAVNDPFEEAAQRWSVHYATEVSSNLVRRVVERQGKLLDGAQPARVQAEVLPAPTQPAEAVYVFVDGSMVSTQTGWREVKLGIVVRAEHRLAGTEEQRGMVTQARYVAHMGGVDAFGARLNEALQAAQVHAAKRVVWLGDGAPWIWNLAEELTPGAEQLVDWRHVEEKSNACAKVLFGLTDPCVALWTRQLAALLWEKHVPPPLASPDPFDAPALGTAAPPHVAAALAELDESWDLATSGNKRDAIANLGNYLDQHQNRLNYRAFRNGGDPTGSGTVESGHKHVIQSRMKRAGQHWNATNADRMAQLRATYRTCGPSALYDVIQRAAA